MQGLKARRAALARAVRDAAATESAAMSAQRRGFQEALFYLQASGMVGAAMSAGCAEPACSANGDLWRGRLAACFAAPRFRIPPDLPGHGRGWYSRTATVAHRAEERRVGKEGGEAWKDREAPAN